MRTSRPAAILAAVTLDTAAAAETATYTLDNARR